MCWYKQFIVTFQRLFCITREPYNISFSTTQKGFSGLSICFHNTSGNCTASIVIIHCFYTYYIIHYIYVCIKNNTTFYYFPKITLCKIHFYALEKKKHPAPLSPYIDLFTRRRFTMKFYDLVRYPHAVHETEDFV